ncbi:carbohydrate ABC transporter permease [Alteribacillus sp. YIM 98480]|uniref:carbohydrate ABC transporter permease n=1 Tax=Alteribacillus sp. YIM 98480 TaxID=2606599 RepID=UPI001E392362|nr:sugar ABC transporter permease [Alteribacillus sp. YIM 98480]
MEGWSVINDWSSFKYKGGFSIERRINKRDVPLILAFLVPGLTVFTVVTVVPSGFAVSYSFYEASSFVGQPTFVLFDNYVALIQDQRFWRDVWQTFIYAFSAVSLQIVVGIIIALILNQHFKGRDFLRGVSVVPYIIPVIVVTIGWEWILDTNFGVVNYVIGLFGFGGVHFLSANMAMFTAVLLSVWTWTPFVTLVFLSGLQTISNELYESARLDGANSWQQFWLITLPMMKDILITIVLLRGLWMFNKFDLMWLLTGGGPLERTETLPIYTYLNTFNLNRVGYGATVAVSSAVIMLIIMLIYLKITQEAPEKLTSKKRKYKHNKKIEMHNQSLHERNERL